ncbi:hypothetical protein [Cohnella candidum]|uniref:Oligosaccharide repeat unit polymerase n=1 Tax=Cohnella candidum TaxID=2674991 RepID=A0A3G3K0C8_9BACL|nr:hypothetical protein [Cohnella candidum]AYQ73842.1 hypothetical protein EAV92_15395 [Cohnella candidum]
MNWTILNPRLLLLLVVSSSTAIWFFYRPMFAYEKYYSLNGFANFLFFYLIIFICCFLTEKTGWARKTEPGTALERFRRAYGSGDALRKEALALALVAGGAQLLWLIRIVLFQGIGPLVDMLIVRQDFLAFKQQVVNVTSISGVTTLTQLGMIASSLYAVCVFGLKRKSSFGMWALILFPGVLRGLFFSERVAFLELVVPILVAAVLFGRIKVTITKIALAGLAVILFFSAAESVRSYQYYSKTGFSQEGAYAYGIGRFFDYISSSVNHSMAMPDLSERTVGFPALMFNGWINLATNVLPASSLRQFLHMDETTQAYANVKSSPYSAADYTNMGFFGEIFADSGYLYVLYALVYGWFIAMAYKGIRRYEVGWMAIYPAVFFSLLESYRITYLFDTRMFYPLLYIALRYWLHSMRQAKSAKFEWAEGSA